MSGVKSSFLKMQGPPFLESALHEESQKKSLDIRLILVPQSVCAYHELGIILREGRKQLDWNLWFLR